MTEDSGSIVTRIDGDAATFIVRNTDRGPVLSARGELDLAAVDQLRAGLTGLEQVWQAAAVIDLSEVSFLASVGIAELIAAVERAETHGRTVAVVAAGPVTRRPLEMLGLTETLRLAPDAAQAWAALGD